MPVARDLRLVCTFEPDKLRATLITAARTICWMPRSTAGSANMEEKGFEYDVLGYDFATRSCLQMVLANHRNIHYMCLQI